MIDETHNRDEERDHVVFAAMRLAALLAWREQYPLHRIKQTAELAYLHHVLESGEKKSKLASALGVGATKFSELTGKLHARFAQTDRAHGLPRQLLSLLWAGPLTRAQINKSLTNHTREEIDDALDALIDEERVEELSGRTKKYTTTRAIQRLSVVPWIAKIDGLNTLIEHVNLAIVRRLQEADERAMVRNISFQVHPSQVHELREFYESTLLPFLAELDTKSSDASDPVHMKFSILWAPEEPASASEPGD